jgi:hypothetical protein
MNPDADKDPALELVHRPPDAQSGLYERDGRYTSVLEALHGENFLSYRRAWRERERENDPGDFPLSLDFRINGGCQLKCVMCPLPERLKTRGGGSKLIPLSLFQRLLSEGRERGLPAVTLGLGSEPLLNEELPRILDICGKNRVMDIRLGTNGLLLSPSRLDSLLDSPLTRLEISVDAATPESYRYARGGDFHLLVRIIDLFLEKREKRRQTLPLLRLSFLILPRNRKELPAFIERFKDKADMLSIQRPLWFPESALRREELEPRRSPGRCRQPWQRLSILEDGALWPCCSWYGEGLLSLNAHRFTLADAWRSPEMEALREALEKGEPPLPCRKCREAGTF